MKHQVSRLSPHQNGKVFAVLMAVVSLVFIVPFALFSAIFVPRAGPGVFVMILAPLFYLVMTYLMTALGCWFYNLMFRFIGGIEFESTPASA